MLIGIVPIIIIANWRATSYLYENTSYDESTPAIERRTVRVRVVRRPPR